MNTPRFTSAEQALIALADAIPPLFFRLKDRAEALHRDAGFSAPERAVLRDVVATSAASVPALASMRGVTRQAIQPIVDRLRIRGLIEERKNPLHKRSPLLVATSTGIAANDQMRAAEYQALGDVARELNLQDLEAALATIELLTHMFAENDPSP